MAQVIRGESESFEAMLRRFGRKVADAGIIAEAKRRESYEPPAERRRRKAAKSRSRARD